MAIKRVAVTGGLGFIGRNLVSDLTERGYSVRVLDWADPDSSAVPGGVLIDRVDVRDADATERALRSADAVVHLAAATRVVESIERPGEHLDTNVRGTFNVLEAMRRNGVETIVNASTGGAILGDVEPPIDETMMPEPASPYGASKLAAEGFLSAYSGSYGLSCISLRFANVYGPGSRHKGSAVAAFMNRALAGEPITVWGDGSQARDFVHVRDICRGVALALESGLSGVYQLGSGRPTTLSELIGKIEAASGVSLEIDRQPARQGEVHRTWCRVDKAERDLGYRPEIALDDGLAETWAWFRGSGA